MTASELISKFEEKYSELITSGMSLQGVMLNPEVVHVGLYEKEGMAAPEDTVSSRTHHIMVEYPLVFDHRKFSRTFNGFDVLGAVQSNDVDLKEWFETGDPEKRAKSDVPMEKFWAPEKFEAFVDQKGEEIGQRLGNPGMSRKDILDALAFGNFEAHKEWCESLT